MENKEVLEELKEINKSIETLYQTVDDIELNTALIVYSQYPNKNKIDINSTSNSDINLQILTIIFGFLVGYFLVKSFFDSYRY